MTLDIVIADDHVLFRQGLAALIREQPGWRVIAEAGTGSEAIALARKLKPDVVILDVEMPDMNGIDAAETISAVSPATHIVALSMYANPHYRQGMLKNGAAIYVRKSQSIDELVAAIRTAVEGGAGTDVPDHDTPDADHAVSASVESGTLSNREREVLRLLAEGRRMNDIAAALGISLKTVETYRARLQQKLRISDVSGLVRFAIRAGLVDPNR